MCIYIKVLQICSGNGHVEVQRFRPHTFLKEAERVGEKSELQERVIASLNIRANQVSVCKSMQGCIFIEHGRHSVCLSTHSRLTDNVPILNIKKNKSLSRAREYLDNTGLVDSGVAEIVSVLEEYFGNDGRTAYLFTADHGMTNWGKIFDLL